VEENARGIHVTMSSAVAEESVL